MNPSLSASSPPSLKNLLATRLPVFLLLAALGCGIDLWTKHWMFRQPDLSRGDVRWVWEPNAGFQLSLNEGALFGMGQGQVLLFALVSVAAALGLPIWLFVSHAARDWRLTVVLGLILAGILGNLYDRLGWHGLQWADFRMDRNGPVYAVRDFLLLAWRWSPDPQQRLVWPNFNIADALLVCGSAALVLLSCFPPGHGHDLATTPSAPNGPASQRSEIPAPGRD